MSQSVLAAAGIIFILIIFAAVIYFAVRALNAERAEPEDAEPQPVPAPAPDALSSLRARYEAMYIMNDVPGSAMTLRIVTNSYMPPYSAARHYCWIKNGELRMFPLWESIAASANATGSLDIVPREWRIPLSDIICFASEHGLPSKFVVLQFKVDSEVLTLSFGDEAARIFGTLIPQKDFSQLLDELYPKSSRNIYDIRESFQSLKELREEDLITEDEYAAKKKEMLILM